MIQMVGTDHTLAPVNVRSFFSFTKEESIQFMTQIQIDLKADGVLLLSTCNRMELWVSTDREEPDNLLHEICLFKDVNEERYRGYFQGRTDEEAVEHLFALTCGLKSAILAEDQILTQVKSSLAFARENYFTDSVIEVLFRMAVTAAKKVKTSVTFTHADSTAIEQAVSMLKEQRFNFKGANCMVIGNGEYGKIAANTLVKNGANVTVTVRQYHRGHVEIPAGCSRINYGDRMQYLPECDLVVSATTSPHLTIEYDDLLGMHPDHPIILIDFAIPQDIDPRISHLKSFTLYNIDDFHSDADPENEANRAAYRQTREILAEEESEFWFWMNDRDLVPRIHRIKDQAVEDYNLRMRKIIRKLPLTGEEQMVLNGDMDRAVGKVIAKLIFDLQDHLPDHEFRECVAGMEKVFEKEDDNS
ncbi:glutamyl-tRNA reductase [Bilifractor sp. LCP19S3_H10]|uniref:glutamyl-tRNA reductase n=1 Tax=Bilifractor sp. LCP19S3_H10 TaxID=3438736 RepID=UPI003F9335BA